MDGMGNNIAAGELSKDVDGAEQMIKEHNERKVWMANIYVHTYVRYTAQKTLRILANCFTMVRICGDLD